MSTRPTVSNPTILDIQAYAPGKSKGKPGLRIVKLSSNETPLGPSPRAVSTFKDAATSLERYPDGAAAALREAIGEVYGLSPERIVCGCGSDELIGLLMHAYAGVGDEVVISQHGFLMYKIYAQSFGITPVFAPEKNLRTDIDAVLAAVTPRTKIVCIANPNNPTGSYITKDELATLHAKLPPHVLLLLDGAYAEYAMQGDYSAGRELVDSAENVVMLRTFSKIYGLSALRVGWGYFPVAIADVLNRIRSPFNVSTPGMLAAIAAVRDVAFTEKARRFNAKALADLSNALGALGLKIHPSIGNFLLVEFKNAEQANAANAFLAERGLIVRDVTGYGLPSCLRISIGLEEDNHAVVDALRDFLK